MGKTSTKRTIIMVLGIYIAIGISLNFYLCNKIADIDSKNIMEAKKQFNRDFKNVRNKLNLLIKKKSNITSDKNILVTFFEFKSLSEFDKKKLSYSFGIKLPYYNKNLDREYKKLFSDNIKSLLVKQNKYWNNFTFVLEWYLDENMD